MNPTPLNEVLEKITPLLPLAIKHSRMPLGDTGEYDDLSDIITRSGNGIASNWNSDDENDARMAYLVHAANVLPELVKALEAVAAYHARLRFERTSQEYNTMHEKVESAITLARNVKME